MIRSMVWFALLFELQGGEAEVTGPRRNVIAASMVTSSRHLADQDHVRVPGAACLRRAS